MTLVALYNRFGREAFQTRYGTLERFIDKARSAVSAYYDGAVVHASTMLHTTIPASIGSGLAELQRTYRCLPDDLQVDEGPERKVIQPTPGVETRDRTQTKVSDVQESPLRASELKPRVRFDLSPRWGILIGFCSLILAGVWLASMRNRRTHAQREERQICHEPVTVRLRKHEMQLIVVDITRQGMKLNHAGHIEKRQTIRFYLDGKWLSGKVLWFNADFAGVKFTCNLNDRQYAEITGKPAASAFPGLAPDAAA